jgi:hypothetical protein
MEGVANVRPDGVPDGGSVDSGLGAEFGDTMSSVAHFSLMIFVVATALNLVERLVRSIKVPDIHRQVSSLQQEVASLRAQALKLVSPYVVCRVVLIFNRCRHPCVSDSDGRLVISSRRNQGHVCTGGQG